MERAVLLCSTDTVSRENLIIEEMDAPADESGHIPTTTLDEMERRLISRTLAETNGNRTHAAKSLGISIRTLRNKLKEYKEKNHEIDSAFI
jgi:two-component system response regulator FlrC